MTTAPASLTKAMPTQYSGITWFDDDTWMGRGIKFQMPHPSKWKITDKISEREIPCFEWESEQMGMDMEAHGVFVCINVNNPSEKAIMKIRLQ